MGQKWTVVLDFSGSPDSGDLDSFEDDLAAFDALASAMPGRGFQAVLHASASDMLAAATMGRDHAERSAPGIFGGISRQRVHQLRSHDAFSAPLVELSTGPIWGARAIEKFAQGWARKVGRPPKAS